MNREQKQEFNKNIHKDIRKYDWQEIVNYYDIKDADVFTYDLSKYTTDDENGYDQCCVGTISYGNAWDCPALLRGACNLDCYGLDGCYVMYDDVANHKEFQKNLLKFAPIEWLFGVIKRRATNKRLKKGNVLRFIRLNEVSDLTQRLLDKVCRLCRMLLSDEATKHIIIFTYTKQGHLDFTEASKLSNLIVNASQCINPVYKGGNVYIAVEKEFFDNIVETDIVKKCNCDIACVDTCGLCYEDGGYIIFCLIH